MLSRGLPSVKEMESCVGTCRSMAVAVPYACTILYTRLQYFNVAEWKTGQGGNSKLHKQSEDLEEGQDI